MKFPVSQYTIDWLDHVPLYGLQHDDVLKWKHFPCYWPSVRGLHRSPVKSSHKGQGHGALMFSSICVCIYGWVNNLEADDLRCHCAHYDVTVINKHLCYSLKHRVIFSNNGRTSSATRLATPANTCTDICCGTSIEIEFWLKYAFLCKFRFLYYIHIQCISFLCISIYS